MNTRFLHCLLLWTFRLHSDVNSFRHTVHKYGFVDRYAADLDGRPRLIVIGGENCGLNASLAVKKDATKPPGNLRLSS